MSLFLKIDESNYRLGIWKIDETIDELLDILPDADKYKNEIAQFTSNSRKLEWLSVRVLLLKLLGKEKDIYYQPSGKPYLSDTTWHISISHTKGYVAVILSTGLPGIDIEYYSERVHKIASKFIGDNEKLSEYSGSTTYSLLLHWSAKEVLFKCLDEENVDFKKHLWIEPFEIAPNGKFMAQEYRTPSRNTYSIEYMIFPDFVCTWSVGKTKK